MWYLYKSHPTKRYMRNPLWLGYRRNQARARNGCGVTMIDGAWAGRQGILRKRFSNGAVVQWEPQLHGTYVWSKLALVPEASDDSRNLRSSAVDDAMADLRRRSGL